MVEVYHDEDNNELNHNKYIQIIFHYKSNKILDMVGWNDKINKRFQWWGVQGWEERPGDYHPLGFYGEDHEGQNEMLFDYNFANLVSNEIHHDVMNIRVGSR